MCGDETVILNDDDVAIGYGGQDEEIVVTKAGWQTKEIYQEPVAMAGIRLYL